uniref:NADH-ubiquinone oxidoreductase chain 2 n=1 Tax=Metacrangonyx remyi TaxID=931576 RepID=K7ZVT7_9CRUS|nr:NADH dehydrogenase subunit 2 [Metacrangonyx remyi]CCI69559.1 NADH dehydrogenase subunit 2 [Metacrangonyx remyi]
MYFHPSFFLFSFFLMFSMVMMVSVNSWFLIWFFIEMNLLSFIPLMLVNKSKFLVESSLKYFFVQTFSSILILIGFMLMFIDLSFYNFFFSGLSIKLGLAPFHQWVVNIVEGLTWGLVGVLFTLQKMGPFILMSYMCTLKPSIINLIYFFSLMSAIVGALGGLFTSSLRKILVFSSISHGAWMLLALMNSIYLWGVYFMFYSVILLSVLYILSEFNLSNLNHLFLKVNFFSSFSLGVSVLSMGGLPPLSGFLPKLILMTNFMESYNYFLLGFLLFSVFITLFFYSRLFIMNFIGLSYMNMFLSSKENKGNISLYLNVFGGALTPLFLYTC